MTRTPIQPEELVEPFIVKGMLDWRELCCPLLGAIRTFVKIAAT
jgi:hypothetical protein